MIPISANVSGRGSPDAMSGDGRDTPFSTSNTNEQNGYIFLFIILKKFKINLRNKNRLIIIKFKKYINSRSFTRRRDRGRRQLHRPGNRLPAGGPQSPDNRQPARDQAAQPGRGHRGEVWKVWPSTAGPLPIPLVFIFIKFFNLY